MRCRLGLVALLALGACLTPADPPPQPDSAFGLGGPPFSHWLHARKPDLWHEGDLHLTLLRESGATWARQDFWWSLVEPAPGRWEWNDFDRAVAAYERHGVRLLGILCYAAAWSGGASPATDAERAAFGRYVFEMVRRYRGRVAAWEVWNEPNIQPFWSPTPDARLYAQLLRVAYTQAKAADPACLIVGGALAGPDADFLRGLYQHGAAGHFDVLSYHNYGQHNDGDTERKAVAALRAVLRAHGDGDKPIWQTETGFYTGPVGLSEADQAARLVRYAVGLRALGIARQFQLTLADWAAEGQAPDPSVYRGLLRADYTPKQAWAAHQTLCRRLGAAEFVAALRPAPGVRGFLFDGPPGGPVLVAWRGWDAPPAPARLNLGVPAACIQTLTGELRVLRSDDGVYELPIGREPVYVLAPGPPVLRQRLVRWPEETRLTREPGAAFEISVDNPTPAPLRLDIFPLPDAAEPCVRAAIPSGTHPTIRVAPPDAGRLPLGPAEWRWTLSDADGGHFAAGFGAVEVTAPLRLAFGRLTRLDPARPAIPLRVEHAGSSATAATVELRQDGAPTGPPVTVALAPAAVAEARLPLRVADFSAGRPVTLSALLATADLRLEIATQRRLLRCPPAPPAVTVDGDLREWTEREPFIRPDQMRWEYVGSATTPAPDDLSVTAWAGWNARGLWLALRVRDDRVVLPEARAVWDWDSLQVGLDLGSDAAPGRPYDDNDLEIELGGRADGAPWCYLGACPPGWPQGELSEKLRGAVRADVGAGRVDYELLVPAELIVSAAPLEAGTVLGFSLLVNDNDGAGRAGWQELTPGIGLGKLPAEFAWLWLQAEPRGAP